MPTFGLFIFIQLYRFVVLSEQVIVKFFFLELVCSLVEKRLEQSHPVEGLHHQVCGLLAQVSVEGDLAHNVFIVCQVEAGQDLVFKAGLVEVVRYHGSDLLDGKHFVVCQSSALFYCSITTLTKK